MSVTQLKPMTYWNQNPKDWQKSQSVLFGMSYVLTCRFWFCLYIFALHSDLAKMRFKLSPIQSFFISRFYLVSVGRKIVNTGWSSHWWSISNRVCYYCYFKEYKDFFLRYIEVFLSNILIAWFRWLFLNLGKMEHVLLKGFFTLLTFDI